MEEMTFKLKTQGSLRVSKAKGHWVGWGGRGEFHGKGYDGKRAWNALGIERSLPLTRLQRVSRKRQFILFMVWTGRPMSKKDLWDNCLLPWISQVCSGMKQMSREQQRWELESTARLPQSFQCLVPFPRVGGKRGN